MPAFLRSVRGGRAVDRRREKCFSSSGPTLSALAGCCCGAGGGAAATPSDLKESPGHSRLKFPWEPCPCWCVCVWCACARCVCGCVVCLCVPPAMRSAPVDL
eukprot:6442423-Alexandrium_andersonii.AAC.1